MDLIEVKNFKKSFDGKVIHSDVNFKVKEGSCLGLIGGSGAGKSVILRSLIGLEKPDQGNIFIDGIDISLFSEKDLVEIRKKVAYVFQGGALFDSMNIYENLAYPLREHSSLNESQITKKIADLLEDFGLQGCERLMPAELSGGMQKRVGLARAIILEPKVVLYDEPTAGLDPFNTLNIQKLILKLKNRGVTSILVTHDMPTAYAVCDDMILLSRGHIVAKGTMQELKKESGDVIDKFIRGEQL